MKKWLSVILSVTILFSLHSVVFAESVSLTPPSDWAAESIEKAKSLKITDYDDIYRYRMPITREQFCEMIYNLIGVTTRIKNVPADNPFSDTNNPKVYTLNFIGIIKGKSETEFAPDDFLTREEAATIIIRTVNKFFPMPATEMWFEYEDINNISEWALNSVQTISNLGFMNGVGNNNFAPKATYTTEQAITTIVRVYEATNRAEELTFADKLNVNMPKDKNYMFSPLSIKTALMMAANGASGETLAEILSTASITDLDVYNENIRLILDKYSASDILTLNVSNSIWINSDKTPQRFSKDYETFISETFDATSDIVTDKNAVKEINNWVNEKTAGKIPGIITEDNKNFWAMLINAVYFKGRWQSEFSKSATKKDVFTSRDNTKTEIDFMNKTGWISYSCTDGVSVVSLPYLTRETVFDENGEYVETKVLDGINVSMYLMMSDENFSPEEVLNKSELETKYLSLSVPKFNIEYSMGLNDVLKTIGINKAFDKSAEFNKMFNSGNMWIDSTIHKTYIKVDEEGTEAAAVTAVGMAGSALPPEPIEVKFNKPFTFVIKDNINGEILFMGEYSFAE